MSCSTFQDGHTLHVGPRPLPHPELAQCTAGPEPLKAGLVLRSGAGSAGNRPSLVEAPYALQASLLVAAPCPWLHHRRILGSRPTQRHRLRCAGERSLAHPCARRLLRPNSTVRASVHGRARSLHARAHNAPASLQTRTRSTHEGRTTLTLLAPSNETKESCQGEEEVFTEQCCGVIRAEADFIRLFAAGDPL